MENLDIFVNEGNQMVNEERPPPRMCPRCNSDNTKFCYYNNYSVSQPRYFCKNCRRYWTHGGSLRNIPIGGSSRKPKRVRQDQTFQVSSQVASLDNHHYQPLFNVQENNEFFGSFVGGGSSSGSVVTNHFGYNAMMQPIGSFQQDYFNVGSNDLIGNPLINQSIGGNVDDYNGFRINNQEEQNMWNQSFNNIMNMNHNASTSGTIQYPGAGAGVGVGVGAEMNKITNNCVFGSFYHLEKHGP